MFISALRLKNNLPGVGYLEKTIDDDFSVKRAFSGIRPIRDDWCNLLRRRKNEKPSAKPGYDPPGFMGWQFSNEEEPKRHVIYHSDHLLADAFESGRLRAAGSEQTLKSLGLMNSRGQYTPTHLQKHRHLLESLGAFPASALWDNSAFIAEESEAQSVRFYQAVTNEPYQGLMIACFIPCEVQTKSGATAHSAIWVARPCQLTKYGKLIERSLFFFDGTRLQRLQHVDALPEEIREKLDDSAQVLTVDQSVLLPPLTFMATHIVPLESKWLEPDAGHSRSHSSAATGSALVPVFAAVAAKGTIDKLPLGDSASLFDCYDYNGLRKQMSGLPANVKNCDLLLCRRDIPMVGNGDTALKALQTCG